MTPHEESFRAPLIRIPTPSHKLYRWAARLSALANEMTLAGEGALSNRVDCAAADILLAADENAKREIKKSRNVR